jgi:tripartite-type tricarboxylate transporter receptor subunit TctC
MKSCALLSIAPRLRGRCAQLAANPARQITVVMPFAAGGVGIIIARILTVHTTRTLRQKRHRFPVC